MAQNKFSDRMKQLDDSRLYEIVTKQRSEYEPEALLAAETELEYRNLSPEQMHEAKADFQQREDYANEPLSQVERI